MLLKQPQRWGARAPHLVRRHVWPLYLPTSRNHVLCGVLADHLLFHVTVACVQALSLLAA